MSENNQKIAIVLFNLGAPDQKQSIEPFLNNFFNDKNIIALPNPFRFMLAKWISYRRAKKVAKNVYAHLGGKSPLLENTKSQAKALDHYLRDHLTGEFKIFVSMRYWHPMSDEVIQEIKSYQPDKIISIPLYPQFSTTTSFSSFQDWDKKALKAELNIPHVKIGCYPLEKGFIKASADLVLKTYQKAVSQTDQKIRILFSAHGLPEKVIKAGDPYQWQCEQTAKKIAETLNIKDLDWQICYQSRVGKLKWIGPSIRHALEKAATDNVGVIVYPHAFVSEHSETLVELDIEYKKIAEDLNLFYYDRVPTVRCHPDFIKGLGNLVLNNIKKHGIVPFDQNNQCPSNFNKCMCRDMRKK